MVDQISAATNGGNVFGGPKFAVEVLSKNNLGRTWGTNNN